MTRLFDAVVLLAGLVFAQLALAVAPTLLVPADLFAARDLRKARTATAFPVPVDDEQRVRERILQTYYFLADTDAWEHPEVPAGWVRPGSRLEHDLELGSPEWPKRERSEIELPVFQLPTLIHFKGEDALTFHLNSAVTHWARRDFQLALQSLDEALVLAGAGEARTLSAAVTQLLRAFFCLQMQFEGVKLKGLGPQGTPAELAESDFRTIARSFFARSLASLPRETYLTAADSTIDRELYGETFDRPIFIGKNFVGKAGKLDNPHLIERNIDLVLWLRTMVSIGLWNAEVLHRRVGGWNVAFDVSERIESLAEALQAVVPSNSDKPVVVAGLERPLVTSPVRLWPRTLHQLGVVGKFIKAFAMLEHKDPVEGLVYADRMIRGSDTDPLRALGFLVAGQIYFDLNHHDLARRAFAWCEAVSPQFQEVLPGCLFWGAESAFWEGRYEIARAAFLRFLEISGDPQFGPWAQLRVAEVAHTLGERDDAFFRFDRLVQLFPAHAVTRSALVRRYCIDVLDARIGVRARRFARATVETALGSLAGPQEFQAKTCLLVSAFQEAYEFTGTSVERIREDAAIQLGFFDAYVQRFPTSRYLPLFEDRVRKLRAAFARYLADTAQCRPLLAAYGQHAAVLDHLGDAAKRVLRTLQWGKDERRLVLRCSALKGDLAMWERMRTQDVADDGGALANLLFDFSRLEQPPGKRAQAGARIVDRLPVNEMTELMIAAEQAGNGYVRNVRFWEGLGAVMVTRADLSGLLARPVIRNAIRKTIEKDAVKVLASDVACIWLLNVLGELQRRDWDRLAELKSADDWAGLIARGRTRGGTEEPSGCEVRVASRLFSISEREVSETRDRRVVLPYLEKVGVGGDPDAWLGYAQRVERRPRTKLEELRAIYERIARESKDERVSKLARLWLERRDGLPAWP